MAKSVPLRFPGSVGPGMFTFGWLMFHPYLLSFPWYQWFHFRFIYSYIWLPVLPPFIWSPKSLTMSAFYPMYTIYLFRSERFCCIMILFNSAFGCWLLGHFLTLQGAYFVIYKRGRQHHMTIARGIDNPHQISFLTFLWLPVINFFWRMLNSATKQSW